MYALCVFEWHFLLSCPSRKKGKRYLSTLASLQSTQGNFAATLLSKTQTTNHRLWPRWPRFFCPGTFLRVEGWGCRVPCWRQAHLMSWVRSISSRFIPELFDLCGLFLLGWLLGFRVQAAPVSEQLLSLLSHTFVCFHSMYAQSAPWLIAIPLTGLAAAVKFRSGRDSCRVWWVDVG